MFLVGLYRNYRFLMLELLFPLLSVLGLGCSLLSSSFYIVPMSGGFFLDNYRAEYIVVIVFIFNAVLLSNLASLLPKAFLITLCPEFCFILGATGFSVLFLFLGYTVSSFSSCFLVSGLVPPKANMGLSFFELASCLSRVASLGGRLFANVSAGHLLLEILFLIILVVVIREFIYFLGGGSFYSTCTSLEIFVACLQAFVIACLLQVYIDV